ncbi:cupin domain-containing protein [Nisaea sp.]|uniref:cupin domain-containing protein n=1 Tax=Nisaea sp. TaxID=2024842 RepID=UPI002B268AF7|nr:cupin domain-containing protein [Nisaea sp.]
MIFQVFASDRPQEMELLIPPGPAMLYVEVGSFLLGNTALGPGKTDFVSGPKPLPIRGVGQICVWSIGKTPVEPPEHCKLVKTAPLSIAPGEVVFRLDTVGFPSGAVAYRHVHPGPGYRYLIKGALEIRSDHDSTEITPGEVWFEDTNSPVTAFNVTDGESQFVRAHLLPRDFLGKPSIKYLNDEDHDKPKLQSNHRFREHVVKI